MANNINIVATANTTQIKQATTDFDRLKQSVGQLSSAVPGLGKAIASLKGGVIGLSVAAAALGASMAFKWNKIIDDAGDLGDKLGYTATQAHILQLALSNVGADIGALELLQNKLATSMNKFKSETEGTGRAFKTLGVNILDSKGQFVAQQSVMDQLVAKYKQGSLNVEEQAALVQILGKNYRGTIQAHEAAVAALELENQYRSIGIGLSEQATKAATDNETANLNLNIVMSDMGSKMVETVIPAVTELTKWFTESYTSGGLVADAVWFIQKALQIAIPILSVFAVGVRTIAYGFEAMVEAGSSAIQIINALLHLDINKALDIKNASGDAQKKLFDNYVNNVTGLMTAGVGDGKRTIATPSQTSTLGRVGGGAPDPIKVKDTKTDAEKAAEAIARLIEQLNGEALATENLNKVNLIKIELAKSEYSLASSILKQHAESIALTIDNANAAKLLNDLNRSTRNTADDFVDSVHNEIKALDMNKREYDRMIIIKQLDKKLTEDVIKLRESGLYTIQRETELINENRVAIERVTSASEQGRISDEDWFGNGFRKYSQSVGTLNDALTNFVTDGLSKTADAFRNLFTDGKFGFRELASSILSDLAKLIVQFYIMQPIIDSFKDSLNMSGSSGTGSGFGLLGDLFSSASDFFGGFFAEGGIPPVGKPSIVGEKGPEIFVPNTAGKIIPNDMLSSGSTSGGSTVLYNPSFKVEIQGNASESTVREARLQLEQMERVSRQTIATELKSGGLLNHHSINAF